MTDRQFLAARAERHSAQLIATLDKLVQELPEELTIEDLEHHDWLLRLVLLADDINNATPLEVLDYAKRKA